MLFDDDICDGYDLSDLNIRVNNYETQANKGCDVQSTW